MSVRGVMEEGILRRIGNGSSTKIWEHKWIPQAPNGKPSTPRPQNCEYDTVQHLINNKRWNSNVVFRIFNKSDAEKIHSIPVSLAGREDSNYWKYSEGGEYTVRSGYKRLMTESSSSNTKKENAGTSLEAGSSQSNQLWNTLWKLNIKHKIKVFIWKCINGALPVTEAIFKRTTLGDPVCKDCGEEPEKVKHTLLQCPLALAIWKVAPLTWEGAKDQVGNFQRWWSRITEARKRQDGRSHLGLTTKILW